MLSSRCPTCGRVPKRSSEANKRYWAILHALSERIKPNGTQYSAESWHEYWKGKLLGVEEIKLPNGKTYQRPNSTADLGKDEFGDYMTQVEAWAAEHGVTLDE